MRFLGIDLGWVSGATGLCCLEWQSQSLTLQALERRDDIRDILTWVDYWLPGNTPGLVAIDAPTIIPNPKGMRTCDRQAHQLLGKFHAGCYPANQSLGFAPRTTGFSQALEQRQIIHAPLISPFQPGRYQIEVFPHATTVQLFNLARIIKYKKGRITERQAGLSQLRTLITTHFPVINPPLLDCSLPDIPAKGLELKAVEDKLDALICAYTGAYWWAWGTEKNWVLGGLEFNPYPHDSRAYVNTGFMIVPQNSKQ